MVQLEIPRMLPSMKNNIWTSPDDTMAETF